MIRYALRCSAGHAFESWFRSAEAFETLRAGGHVSCPVCGATEVDKALMAPQVRPARKAAAVAQAEAPAPEAPGPLAAPQSPREAALAELRRRIEERSEYVGLGFAAEARRIHAGDAPERPIHGEARIEEARALLDEGVPVAPLPFLPARKAN
jgi:hypothetical protein